jgi:hypothetical protein
MVSAILFPATEFMFATTIGIFVFKDVVGVTSISSLDFHLK